MEDTSGNLEIVQCTDNTADVLTVVRAQESTTALVFPTGSRVELRTTAGTFGEFIQQSGDQMAGELDMNGNVLRDPLITDGEARNLPLRGTDGGTANEIVVPTAAGAPTLGGNTILHTGNTSAYVQDPREVNTGEGITGGGDLSTNRTHDLDMPGLNTMDASTLANDDGMLVYDADAAEHKVITNEKGGTRIVAVTSTRDFALTDSNAFLHCDATDRTLTLVDSIFHIGTEIALGCPGAGSITVAVGGAQSITSLASDLDIKPNGGGAYLVQYAANTWLLVGDLQ
jgi:hypothetical protein